MALLRAPFRMRAPIKNIGQRVRELRLARHLSQAALARKARVSLTFIGGVERGVVNCSLVTLLHIAEGLDCTLSQLIPIEAPESYAMLSADDQRRVRDALDALGSILTPRKRARRASKR